MKKLTIITVVKNDNVGLNKTIKSVLSSKIECEHLIIDGSNSKLLLCSDHNFIRHIWGSDSGISDAFNKGVSIASGQYILFLNAGDELLPSAKELINSFLTDDCVDCIWFAVYRILENGQKSIFKPRLKYLKYAMTAPHQGLFLRKDIFSEIGGFPYQKYSMDHYVSLKIISKYPKYKIKCFNIPIATYPSGGHSSQGGGWPFIYNIWNTLRIRPFYFPIAILVNILLIFKSRMR